MNNKDEQKMSYKGDSYRALWAVLDWLFLEFFTEISHEKWDAAESFLCANAWESLSVFGDEISMERKRREEAEKILRPTAEMRRVADLLTNVVAIMNRPKEKISIEVTLRPDGFVIEVACDTSWMLRPELEEVEVVDGKMTLRHKREVAVVTTE